MADGDRDKEQVSRDTNSKTSGDTWLLSNASAISTISTTTAQVSSGGSGHNLEHEFPTPPLAIISTRIKSASALAACAHYETATVKYPYETTNLGRLLKMVGECLKGRKALSIAFIVHGSPGCFKLCSKKVRRFMPSCIEVRARRHALH